MGILRDLRNYRKIVRFLNDIRKRGVGHASIVTTGTRIIVTANDDYSKRCGVDERMGIDEDMWTPASDY